MPSNKGLQLSRPPGVAPAAIRPARPTPVSSRCILAASLGGFGSPVSGWAGS
jgi:hypothetical protein